MLLIAAIAIGATIMAGNFRERALRNSERELENTVLLLARHFDQQLEDFEVVQQDLIAYIQSNGITTSETATGAGCPARDIHLMLKSKMDALSYVGGINVFDADGELINSSGVWPIPPVSVADRAYFKTFKSDPNSPVRADRAGLQPHHRRLDHRDRAQGHRTERRIPRRHRPRHRARQFRKILRLRGARHRVRRSPCTTATARCSRAIRISTR